MQSKILFVHIIITVQGVNKKLIPIHTCLQMKSFQNLEMTIQV